ncbi:hypothetical protein GCM10020256_24620 [Streptomyces thermocoprophilus]
METPGIGYTHSDRNWYLAVGSAQTNTTGVITVVPGTDGRPKVSLDYQVNVWDRYNWDPGKATPIGPTTVTDADMARLHRTGLAKEFDMRGSGTVQHYDLGTETGDLPDPRFPDATELEWTSDAMEMLGEVQTIQKVRTAECSLHSAALLHRKLFIPRA